MNGVVTFNYAEWVLQYPEFGSVTAFQAQSFFNRVTIGSLCDNSPNSPIQDLFRRTILLNMAVAHMAALYASINGQPPRGIVGRISNATEGSVSVGLDYVASTSDTQAFWNQTPYGAEFWASTQQYRTGFYVPPLRRPGTPAVPRGGRRW